jgi:peptide/nickel transport system permease protein
MATKALARVQQPDAVSVSQVSLLLRRFRRHRLGIVGLAVLTVLALSVVLVPVLSPYNYDTPSAGLVLAPAGSLDANGRLHLLGTDHLSRDVFTRLFYGGRVSLSLALLSALAIVVTGSLIGSLAGLFGGWVDTLLMRFTDFMLGLPIIPMYVFTLTLFKPPPLESTNVGRELFKLSVVFVLFGWMGVSRLVRASILSLRSRPFVEASRALGAGNTRIIFRHVLPNAIGPVLVAAVFLVGDFIIFESVLAYIGSGLDDTVVPSWGNLIVASESYVGSMTTLNPFQEIAGWLLIFPSLFIFATVLSVNFIGDALRDALDPHAVSGKPGTRSR